MENPIYNSAGRPPDTSDIPFLFKDFGYGVDTYTDRYKRLGEGVTNPPLCHIAFNNRSYNGNSLDKRKGHATHSTNGTKVNLNLFAMNDPEGDKLVGIWKSGVNMTFEVWNGTAWTSISTLSTDINDQVRFSFASTFVSDETTGLIEARLYFTNGQIPLKYFDGTTIQTVLDGAEEIFANYITALENSLVIANLGNTFGVHQLAVAKAGTHQFRRDTDVDYENSSRIVSLDGEITNVLAFGSRIFVFTRSDGLWLVDGKTLIPTRISSYNCVAPFSVASGSDLIFFATERGIRSFNLETQSMRRVGLDIEKVYDNADFSFLQGAPAIVTPEGEYKFFVGDLEYEGVAYENVQLVYDTELSKLRQQDTWFIDFLPFTVTDYVNWTNASGFTSTYLGRGSKVLLTEVGADDDGEDITTIWESKDIRFADYQQEISLQNNYITYRVPVDDVSLKVFARCEFSGFDGSGVESGWTEIADEIVGTMSKAVNQINTPSINTLSGNTLAIRLEVSGSTEFRLYEVENSYSLNNTDINYNGSS